MQIKIDEVFSLGKKNDKQLLSPGISVSLASSQVWHVYPVKSVVMQCCGIGLHHQFTYDNCISLQAGESSSVMKQSRDVQIHFAAWSEIQDGTTLIPYTEADPDLYFGTGDGPTIPPCHTQGQ